MQQIIIVKYCKKCAAMNISILIPSFIRSCRYIFIIQSPINVYMYRVAPTYGPTRLEQVERTKLSRKVLYLFCNAHNS